ncbi:TPA: superantigen-like protein SSL2 [Staphylococcus aureus]|uniref:superantigen-like protein SSL2 n=1 Tax=Staphylococcus aureus TaxID=1280 RepID=UPI000AFE75CF|nr:superantigen-like protein SSL2 [Staphylococcus aureus]MBO8798276.1 superantigen-like protein SSL2 [Staphylococcus aureus]MCB8264455.1 superantigen-like protein SSL2 [Staphylococcus aureus]MCB8272410.1 superantigen-like protein SSL2 [Staphylococcus aureus]MCC5344591.1 superantigen-like protein SSL2 [Staphylococcus aureus]MDT3277209.1 superantigen-like protein SSL2 [Staphylococcus aureus]
MKMKSIAKVSLVLGILATGVNTVTEQPVHAENKHVQVSQNSKNLKAYYTQPSVEYKNVTGYISSIQPKAGTKFMNIIEGNAVNNLALVGKDKQHYHTGVHRNLDIFYVNEDKRFEGSKYSIGGITESSDKVVDQIAEARVIKEDHTGEYDYDFFPFKIDKEAMTLKEVDFKIRKHLIDHYGLYGEMSSGTVTVKMKYYGKYTFELDKKLQEDRMADIIKVTDIDRIEVIVKKA